MLLEKIADKKADINFDALVMLDGEGINENAGANGIDMPVYSFTIPDRMKYDGKAYCELRQSIRDITERVLLIADKKDISAVNHLIWECSNASGYLLADSDNPYIVEEMVTKKDIMLWDIQAQHAKENDQAFMSGWNNSYNNQSFTDEELNEYVMDSRIKLEAFLNKNADVLEVGVGSGMIACELAPLCNTYDGSDISAMVLEQLERMFAQKGINNMKLYQLSADEADKTGKLYDVILMSSVTEYFSGYNYMNLVISNCIKALKDKGHIFIADVFDLELKEEYRNSVNSYAEKHPGCRHKKDFSHELFIPRQYWMNLAALHPYIDSVEVTNKIGIADNEINRYRYDVMITIDKTRTDVASGKIIKAQLGYDKNSDSII